MRLPTPETRRVNAGMGLVELAVTSVLIVLVATAAFTLGTATTGAYGTATDEARLVDDLSRGVSQLADRLRRARADSLALDTSAGVCVLDYQVALGYDDLAAEIVWADNRLAFEDEPGELLDGVDNDDDGLVDEGRVVFVRDVGGLGEHKVVVATGVARAGAGETPGNAVDDDGDGLVDEPGFSLALQDGGVLLELTVVRALGETEVVARTMTRLVGPRN